MRLLTAVLLLVALGAAAVCAAEFRRGRSVVTWPGRPVRDVRDVRRRAAAGFVEAFGFALVLSGSLLRVRPLNWLGVVLVLVGAFGMSVARRGLAPRRARS